MTASAPLVLGVVGVSRKPDERRVPLHPGHLDRIPDDLRPSVLLETGYGHRFGVTDDELRPLVGGILDRTALFAASDVLLLPKPQHEDLEEMRGGPCCGGGRISSRTR